MQTKPLKIRVFAGSKNNPQLAPFETAVQRVIERRPTRDFLVEILLNEKMRKVNWGPKQVVDWLIDSDHYFIICHAHQGNDDWDVQELYYQQFPRLWNSSGFPSKIKLTCAIEIQDKYRYICKTCVHSEESAQPQESVGILYAH